MVEKISECDSVLGGVQPNSIIPARSLILLSQHSGAINMAGTANGESMEAKATGETRKSPLESAKQIAATMCRQPKEAKWLGVRMENFYRAYHKKIADPIGLQG